MFLMNSGISLSLTCAQVHVLLILKATVKNERVWSTSEKWCSCLFWFGLVKYFPCRVRRSFLTSFLPSRRFSNPGWKGTMTTKWNVIKVGLVRSSFFNLFVFQTFMFHFLFSRIVFVFRCSNSFRRHHHWLHEHDRRHGWRHGHRHGVGGRRLQHEHEYEHQQQWTETETKKWPNSWLGYWFM